jgi:hypothetical protein
MKLSALLLLCGPMLLLTAACTKVCAAQVREISVTPNSGGMGAMTQLTPETQNLQGTLQAAPQAVTLSSSQLASGAPPDSGDSSAAAVVVAAQNPPVAYKMVPPSPPPGEPIEEHHNEGDC